MQCSLSGYVYCCRELRYAALLQVLDLVHFVTRIRMLIFCCVVLLQETQKGDITLALEWMPVELDDD